MFEQFQEIHAHRAFLFFQEVLAEWIERVSASVLARVPLLDVVVKVVAELLLCLIFCKERARFGVLVGYVLLLGLLVGSDILEFRISFGVDLSVSVRITVASPFVA